MLLTAHNGSGLSTGTEKRQETAETFDRLNGKPRFWTDQLVQSVSLLL